MQGVMRKIGGTLAAVMLSVSCCLFPYSQAAYAWIQVAIPAGYALAAVLATLGIGVAITSDDDASALWGEFELYTDDLDALGQQVSAMQDAAIEAGTASGTLTNVTKQQVSQDEMNAISTMFEAAGNAGSFALDQLSMMASDGILGILPFLLSGFIADITGSTVDIGHLSGIAIPGAGTQNVRLLNSYDDPGLVYPGTGFSVAALFSSVYFRIQGYEGLYSACKGRLGPQTIYLDKGTTIHGDIYKVGGSGSDVSYSLASFDSAVSFNSVYDIHFISNGNPTQSNNTISINNYATGAGSFVRNVLLAWDYMNLEPKGQWKWVGAWQTDVTDNPDVIGGSDFWDDAKENKDILNPSAGAAVIGSDAVFDGDYIANRGSITIPTDWSGINSWADALGATHAGVAQGALDGTISGTSAGTAVDVGTGELVNGNVSDLTKPGSNTSIALPLPGLFDGVVDAVSDKFPFCIPGDLYQCLAALSAAPVAPAFDWTFALSHVGLHDVTIRVDLVEFDQVAFILRVGLSVTMIIGLVFLSTRLLNMWGGD